MARPDRYAYCYVQDPEPMGCDDCGTNHKDHGRKWTPSAGIHTYIRPSNALIAQRMRRRRNLAEKPLLDRVLGRAPQEEPGGH